MIFLFVFLPVDFEIATVSKFSTSSLFGVSFFAIFDAISILMMFLSNFFGIFDPVDFFADCFVLAIFQFIQLKKMKKFTSVTQITPGEWYKYSYEGIIIYKTKENKLIVFIVMIFLNLFQFYNVQIVIIIIMNIMLMKIH